ncbi:hypothetical protein Mapa_015573 [Marchantia paleacea]|nr:hypothetical protein Mapa_015573 [Marchantia paleacea]
MALLPCSRWRLGAGFAAPGLGGGARWRSLLGPSFCAARSRRGLRILAQAEAKASSASQEQAENRTEDAGSSFLRMWERAQQRRDANDYEKNPAESTIADAGAEDWGRRDEAFKQMLQMPSEERDRIQRRQIVDRAAAALAAANAFLAQYPVSPPKKSVPTKKAQIATKSKGTKVVPVSVVEVRPQKLSGLRAAVDATPGVTPATNSTFEGTPGPEFWSWVPEPLDAESKGPPLSSKSKSSDPIPQLSRKEEFGPSFVLPWEDYEERASEDLPLIFQSRAVPSLPPFQSLLEIGKEELEGAEQESVVAPQPDLRMPDSDTEIASAVNEKQRDSESSTRGIHEDGSRWWQETGVEYRENGIVCNWTVIRGVSADEGTEWEEKFWEASDAFDYKELGAEKSGRDSSGRVWHEFWKEAMWQDLNNGLQHMEKTADKWAQDGSGGQWHEKWYEHYDASGRADKWADKWSQIDPDTPLEPGHAHSWHERWGETYDGEGGTMKYTDKWAERQEECGGWTKWGDKWDEHFDQSGQGVKQGETWWQGTSGDKWNRTWGEGHNRSGWVHKYGKSSSGEHWDTHEQEDTWYNSKPHFGFRECFDNSVELRRVGERKRPQL